MLILSSQTICWMGLFFAPLISIITTLKLFGIFYLRIWYLRYLCTPSKSLYEVIISHYSNLSVMQISRPLEPPPY